MPEARKGARAVPLREAAGKIPPHAPEVETTVLSMAIRDPDYAGRIASVLAPERIYDAQKRRVFKAIVAIVDRGEAVDLVSLSEELKRDGFEPYGGSSLGVYLAELSSERVYSSSPERDAIVLEQYAMRRAQIAIGTRLAGLGYDETEDPFETLDRIERELIETVPDFGRYALSDLADEAGAVLERYASRKEEPAPGMGIPTGFRRLDDLLKGWKPGRHYILAAASNAGKTAMGLGFALRAAVRSNNFAGVPTLYVTVEMSAEEIADRALVTGSGVPVESTRNGSLSPDEWADLRRTHERFKGSKLYVYDAARPSFADVARAIRRAVRLYGVRFVVIDYLQRIGWKEFSRDMAEGISAMSGELKGLARELGIAILTLSQITREASKAGRSGIAPTKNDLRGSADIENDADAVIIIYRPEVHGLEYYEKRGRDTYRLAEIIVDKNRHGGLGYLLGSFDPETVAFLDHEPAPPGSAPPAQAEIF